MMIVLLEYVVIFELLDNLLLNMPATFDARLHQLPVFLSLFQEVKWPIDRQRYLPALFLPKLESEASGASL